MTTFPASILLVDDEVGLVVGLKAVLQRAGYQVTTAHTGAEALAVLRQHRPDLILCDVMMPPPNGFQLRELLAKDAGTADIPFVFITARNSEADRVYGLTSGADDYITKPFHRAEVLARVEAVLRRDRLGQQRGLAQAQTELEALRSEITQNFTHELRAPLAIVMPALQMALDERYHGDPQEQRQFIEQALRGTERLRKVIDDVLMLMDLDRHALQAHYRPLEATLDIHKPIMDCARRWGRAQDLRLKLPSASVLMAPLAGFRIALVELVDNACKFSPAGTPIVVRLIPLPNNGFRVLVADEGPGIPLELREKVFERYYQVSQGLSRTYDGLGVGLTIARLFARQFGGDVKIQPGPGCQVAMDLGPAPANAATI